MHSNNRRYLIVALHLMMGALLLAALFSSGPHAIAQKPAVGLGRFEGESDIGSPKRAGSLKFDEPADSYLVSGGGENMWSTNDSFHFVWTKVTGDLSLAAEIKILGAGGNAHRK